MRNENDYGLDEEKTIAIFSELACPFVSSLVTSDVIATICRLGWSDSPQLIYERLICQSQ